jgi:UDP-N-acetylmuramoylalanine-D-glutamate ligase
VIFGIPPRDWNREDRTLTALQDHVILCGLGPTGLDLATAFQEEEIPFVVVEMNPARIREAKKMHMSCTTSLTMFLKRQMCMTNSQK